MAVGSLFHLTEALILPLPRKQYPATMVAAHWQLRSMVSCLHSDTIYYPWNRDIYQLNTSSCEREIVATVPFTPRCLVGAKGFICCGGEQGHFAMIRLPDALDDEIPPFTYDPDARLPLNLDSSRRQTSDASISPSPNAVQRSPVTKTTTVGTELVNCITLWFPPQDLSEKAYPRPLCVSANNDKTVTILDMNELTPLETLHFPDSINRAVISPDGHLLVAIGDDPFMYIHRRTLKRDLRSYGLKEKPEYTWTQWGTVQLEGQRSVDNTEMRGSFAAAFSHSGRYLAVGTQYGIISVFDTASLTDPEVNPLIVSFESSAPGEKVGAVRSMEFSKDPLDLLAWTENSGHVGIADARDNFHSRQIISVEAQGEGVQRMAVSDGIGDTSPFTGSRPSRPDHSGSSEFGADFIGLDHDRQQLRQLTRYLLDRQLSRESERHQNPLTSVELEVLEALQVDRRHRDAARQSESPQRLTSRYQGSETRDTANNLPTTLREFLNINSRTREILRTYSLEHGQDSQRRGLLPRRRGSSSLTAAQLAFDREVRDARDDGEGLRRLTASTERPLNQGESSSLRRQTPAPRYSSAATNPWAELEQLYSFATDNPTADSTTRYMVDVEPEERIMPARPIGSRRPDESRLGGLTAWNLHDSSPEDTRTVPSGIMGCCWSQDGTKLFVGAADGVYEYHVNVVGRRFFPSMTLR